MMTKSTSEAEMRSPQMAGASYENRPMPGGRHVDRSFPPAWAADWAPYPSYCPARTWPGVGQVTLGALAALPAAGFPPVPAVWLITGRAEVQRSVQAQVSWQYHRMSRQALPPSGTIWL